MRRNKWGRIINISSVHGSIASKFKAGYVSSKHGLVGLTKVVALETAEEKITCNAIGPGFVENKLVKKQIKDMRKFRKLLPSKKLKLINEIDNKIPIINFEYYYPKD